jgi:threonine dehydratase
VRVKIPGFLTRRLCTSLLDDVVIVREAELRETLVRLALEEHIIAEGAGALALAAGRRVAGRRKCAVVSGGNIDAGVLAGLLTDIRPRPPRKPRRRRSETPRSPAKASAPPPPPSPSPCKPSHPLSRRFPCDHHRTNYHPAHPHLRHHPA